ncbi:hypothetical protein KIW84_022643, partial [Lathyrus oleraceus]
HKPFNGGFHLLYYLSIKKKQVPAWFIFFSWWDAAQTLTDTLCKEIGKDDLTLNAKVLTLAYSHDGSSSSENWSITCTSNKKTQYDDAVIMTVWLHYSRGFTIQLIWQKEQNWRN